MFCMQNNGYIDHSGSDKYSHQFKYHVDTTSQNLSRLYFVTLSRLVKKG